ncbi:PIN domain-containing protein [Hydrogenophaga soli]|nr:putative toxin-antitoxin system toxin component, PIN family [Burkholderiaceae bacterium]
MKIVLDTSVLVAAARSRLGASFALVASVPSPLFQLCVSVGIYTEWQSVMTRTEHLPPGASPELALGFVRYLASQAHLQDIHYLWRPFLRDPDDDMVLECAVAGGCPYIVTHNVKDFKGSEQLGVSAITPSRFLHILKELKP